MTIMDEQMVTTITTETKIERNDPWCGSGKKYKKCCL